MEHENNNKKSNNDFDKDLNESLFTNDKAETKNKNNENIIDHKNSNYFKSTENNLNSDKESSDYDKNIKINNNTDVDHNNGMNDEGNKLFKKIKNKSSVKIEELENTIIKQQEQNEELMFDIKRIAAEFDNYQKRMKNEMQSTRKFANQNLLIEFSNVMNMFDLALKSTNDDDPLKEGVIMIQNMFIDIFKNNGVDFFVPLNEKFDYKSHEALFSEITHDKEKDNHIVEVFEKGMKLENKIIKVAKVKILIYEEPKN